MTYNAATDTLTVAGDIDPTAASGQDLGDATHRWDLYTQDVIFGGPTGANIVTFPDNVADALHYVDAGDANDYLTFVSTDGSREVVINEDGHANIDFRVEWDSGTQGLFVRGSDGAIIVDGPSLTVPDGWWVGIGAALERIVIDTAGYVAVMGADFGVGVIPSVKLDVDGPIQTIDNRGATGFFQIASAAGASMIPFFYAQSEDAARGTYFLSRPDSAPQTGFTSAAFYFNVRNKANNPLTTGNLLQLANDDVVVVTVDRSGSTIIGGTTPDRRLTVEQSGALTNTIRYVLSLNHITTNPAAALFGTGMEMRLEDAGGIKQVASEMVTLWATATAGAESPLFRGTTYPIGAAGPGFWGFWTWNDLDNNARTIVPNGAGDVTSGVTVMYWLSESGGGTDGNVIMIANGAAVDLYDDGTDVFTLTVAADGSVTVVRSAGATTADLSLLMCWV